VKHERGVALILALLVLSFLTIIGGAFLATSTLDARISDNYKNSIQSLYVAEAGLEEAREVLRSSFFSASELLRISAGADQALSTSKDWAELAAGDDKPIIPLRQLADSSGRVTGHYRVWLRNDAADGIEKSVDRNEVLTLLSLGQVGDALKLIEVTVQKGGFPEADSDPRLRTIDGLEGLVTSIRRNATVVSTTSTIGNVGNPNSYQVTFADGDVDIGPGTGYGLLLVRGTATVVDDFTWHGLLLIIGQGVMRFSGGVQETIHGGLFIARTRAPGGALLGAPADMVFRITDGAQIRAANRLFPYSPIAVRER
jgi:hypothetical protein